VGPWKGAVPVADEHLVAAGGDREEAERRLVATHVRLAAVSGFATGLGGIATLPVLVPAAMAGLYIIDADVGRSRLPARVRHHHGGGPQRDLGDAPGQCGRGSAEERGHGIRKQVTAATLQKVPGQLLIEINKRIGFRLVTKAGEKGVLNLAKLVPLVGGPIGAAVDGVSCRTIAAYAMRTFEPQPFRAVRRTDVMDGEVVEPA
jgi:hypothetical protein